MATIAADCAMGLILGFFISAALSLIRAELAHPAVVVVVLAASVLIVLFRRPNGSLARRPRS